MAPKNTVCLWYERDAEEAARFYEKTFPDRNVELHLYCGGGFRSALAADNLQKMGYTNVISVDGGYKALEKLGAKIATGE